MADAAIARIDALTALASLNNQHREALLLVSWDGLTADEEAQVLGIRTTALRRRVHRVRAALNDNSATVTARTAACAAPAIPSKEIS